MSGRSPDVDAWLARYDHPLKPLVERVRDVMLASDPRLGETIKWSAPTFVYKGNLATFQPRSNQHVSLVFHTGASIPGSHPILEGGTDTGRHARFSDADAVDAARPALEAVVRAWCDWKDG
jgi:hypothetical protein